MNNKRSIFESLLNGRRLVWLDFETTGTRPDVDHILEVAIIITDGDLQEIGEPFHLVVHQPDEILDNMDDIPHDMHTRSGLIEACRESIVDPATLDRQILSYISRYTPKGVNLAGNSVHMDFGFIKKQLPGVRDHLNYRILDVSALKLFAQNWATNVHASAPQKKETHRALDDIRESIEELRHYISAMAQK